MMNELMSILSGSVITVLVLYWNGLINPKSRDLATHCADGLIITNTKESYLIVETITVTREIKLYCTEIKDRQEAEKALIIAGASTHKYPIKQCGDEVSEGVIIVSVSEKQTDHLESIKVVGSNLVSKRNREMLTRMLNGKEEVKAWLKKQYGLCKDEVEENGIHNINLN